MILLLILILSRSTLYLLRLLVAIFSRPSSNINGISCRSIFCDIIEVIGIRPLLFQMTVLFLLFLFLMVRCTCSCSCGSRFLEPRGHRWPSELATWQIMGLPETGIVMLLLFWLKGPELGGWSLWGGYR